MTPLGVVLTGGSSRRMGRDKALLGPRERPLTAVVAEALRGAGADPVVAVGGDGDAIAPHVDAWMPDERPGEGPLAAIATVAAAHPGRGLVVCACDLPWLDAAVLGPLVASLSGGAEDVGGAGGAVYVVAGREQWSVLALSPDAAAATVAAVEAGERALGRVLDPWVARLVPSRSAPLRDVDEPGDLPPGLDR